MRKIGYRTAISQERGRPRASFLQIRRYRPLNEASALPKRSGLRPLLLALIVLLAAVLAFELTRPYRPDNPIDRFIDSLIGRDWIQGDEVENADITYVEMPADSDLDGLLYVTGKRAGYADGAMRLILPALDLDLAVSDGTSRDDLARGPGLFEYSNMPGSEGGNVSIAGHRSRKQFYYLDRVGEGDPLYLVYGGETYAYEYLDRKEIEPTDWSVITNQGIESCTLITCTPIGVANKRMVVRFSLIGSEPGEPAAPAD
ncbi:MAG: sortase [Clostridiales Family XIII bacterium]|jgi:LPXTG-site transpeptidase (sortase) family protein|nr:sortase [Clostridiales Family XIII bacterium]